MIDSLLFFVHHILTLICGVFLSAAFSGVRFSRKNTLIVLAICMACGASLLSAFLLLGEQRVWELYPLLVHALLGILLCVIYKKHWITVLGSITLAYMCCQPSKWFGLMVGLFTTSTTAIWCVRIFITAVTVLLAICYFASHISEIFGKEIRNRLLFASVPLVYYLFDYFVSIYANLQDAHFRLASEFLSFFLCVVFIVFCIVYYHEYEKKMQVQRKNQIIAIAMQQQAKEIEAIRKSELETSLLRHDMRLLLSNLALSIQKNDREAALNMISGYAAQVDAAALHRYCNNNTINYILANFESRCQAAGVTLQTDLEFDSLAVDEVMFASVLSNALDNALNAQAALPEGQRQIKLLLKDSDGKLLLSVRNPFQGTIALDQATGMPLATREGHGYGTQSILYLTEKLGGKCLFSIQDQVFILRIIL